MKNNEINNLNIIKNKKNEIYYFELKYMQKFLLSTMRMNKKNHALKKFCIIYECKIYDRNFNSSKSRKKECYC